MSRPQFLGAFLFSFLLAGCGSDQSAPDEPVLTVTATTVRDAVPASAVALTGVAEPYREADVGFEVTGRLVAVLDVGRSVEVIAKKDAAGTLVTQGEVIAQIDDTTYQQRFEAAELRLASARAGLQATTVDLEEVAPATVARAKAQRDAALAQVDSARASTQSAESNEKTAGADLERARKLLADRQIPRAEFDQTQNAYNTAVANVAKAKAGLTAAREQVEGYEATVAESEASLRFKAENLLRAKAELRELELAVRQAQTDLDRCTLRAPFAGRITFVHASQGDLVQAGAPVLRLTLIDPIKVSVTVSAERERLIRPGSHAFVFPIGQAGFGDGEKVLAGTVFEKGSVADSATRTYRIDIMVRNSRRVLHDGGADDDTTLINFRQLLPAVERNFGEGGPLFVCDTCIVPTDAGQVVYRVKGARFGRPRAANVFQGRLPLERIPVATTGTDAPDFMQILNWAFHRVKPAAGGALALSDGDLLINFEGLDPAAVEGGVRLDRFEWAIRPGDLVPVRFKFDAKSEGLYVSDRAIVARNEKHSVFVIAGDRAREVTVTLGAARGHFREIKGTGINDGTKVVLRGVHYCYENALVSVTAEESAE